MQTLTRSHLRPLSAPPAPVGHYSHKAQPHSLQTLAELALNPLQPRNVQRYHREALNGSLAALASQVLTVAKR